MNYVMQFLKILTLGILLSELTPFNKRSLNSKLIFKHRLKVSTDHLDMAVDSKDGPANYCNDSLLNSEVGHVSLS